ncbi:hypothetical protein AKJ51_01265 [candidate division MSBL1 archaeon SCGC-AAA382A20]|uniref:DUF5320 domain-containing protein n=1 Tax=candidate division MSBL1 archaeon SCGC-AAA382A20 TaxID=1698280 RepID=A0A133VLY1_9EURY|nr:hypothetical protein AKJ51_01265 [candidate division MSBL1 archaeon SCGC-AAA382A20]
MCKSHGHGHEPSCGCRPGVPPGLKKTGVPRPPWRRFVSRDEKRKALEKYREELEKELEAVNEKLEKL